MSSTYLLKMVYKDIFEHLKISKPRFFRHFELNLRLQPISSFQIRFSEHLGISKVTNKPLKYSTKTSTAIRDHLHTCNHQNTPESFKIIGSATNDYHLKIKENLNITRENPQLNKTIKSFPLHLSYS